jgi:anti-anti-sigma factor
MDGITGDRLGVPGGRIEVRRETAGHVLYLSGDVDAPVVGALEAEQSIDELRIVAVDVGGLAYIDSAGLGMLVRWATHAASEGRPAMIRGTTRRFERTLELAGLDTLFSRA